MKQDQEDSKRYEDIINLPHPTTLYRPRMPIRDRGAQFAPFAALNGHEDAILETARQTNEFKELNEDELNLLNYKLQSIMERNKEFVTVEIVYFKEDAFKSGGSFEKYTGIIKKIDTYRGEIVFTDKTRIEIKTIMDLKEVEGLGPEDNEKK